MEDQNKKIHNEYILAATTKLLHHQLAYDVNVIVTSASSRDFWS